MFSYLLEKNRYWKISFFAVSLFSTSKESHYNYSEEQTSLEVNADKPWQLPWEKCVSANVLVIGKKNLFNQFNDTDLLWFSDVSMKYIKRPEAWNGLKWTHWQAFSAVSPNHNQASEFKHLRLSSSHYFKGFWCFKCILQSFSFW